MKRFLFTTALFICFLSCYAQKKVLLTAGTIVPVVSEKEIAAAELTEGQTIELKTVRDVTSETGEVVIPKGSLALARVFKAQRSKLAGTKGRLTIDINEVYLPNGIRVPLCDGTIFFTGKNRTAIVGVAAAVVAAPLVFIPGSKAILPADFEMHPKVEVSQYVYLKEE